MQPHAGQTTGWCAVPVMRAQRERFPEWQWGQFNTAPDSGGSHRERQTSRSELPRKNRAYGPKIAFELGRTLRQPGQLNWSSRAAQTLGLTRTSVETIMVPLWLEMNMPTTLTLKNIPDVVYERLKTSAEAHRRSMNSEAIVCLEAVLLPTRVAPTERLARARALRDSLPKGKFLARDIDSLKREGRP